MFRVLLIASCLSFACLLAAFDTHSIEIGVSADLVGWQRTTIDVFDDGREQFRTAPGGAFYAELMRKLSQSVHLGPGLEYQGERRIEQPGEDGRFHFLIIYFASRVNLPVNSTFACELLLNMGLNILKGNDAYMNGETVNGGYSVSFGCGVSLSEVTLSCLYCMNRGTFATHGFLFRSSLQQENWKLRLGYRF